MMWLFWLGNGVPQASPTPVAAPLHAWIQPTVGIVQIIVTILLAFILWRLSFIVFVRNAEQKIAERNAEWFHKVVVDPQLIALTDFFQEAGELLHQGAETCETAKFNKDQAVLEASAERAIKSFNDLLLPTQRSLSDTVACFDGDLALQTRQSFEKLQDKITDWFEELLEATAVDARQSLPGILSTCKNEIISRLRKFDFEEYGFRRPSLLRSLFWW